MKRVEARYIVMNQTGLHARPATILAQTAARFDADIQVRNGGGFVDGTSILDLLKLGALRGTILTVRAAGDDAREAIEEIGALFGSRFGEGNRE